MLVEVGDGVDDERTEKRERERVVNSARRWESWEAMGRDREGIMATWAGVRVGGEEGGSAIVR